MYWILHDVNLFTSCSSCFFLPSSSSWFPVQIRKDTQMSHTYAELKYIFVFKKSFVMENFTPLHNVKIYVMENFTPFHVVKIWTNLPNHRIGRFSGTLGPGSCIEPSDHEWHPMAPHNQKFACIECKYKPRRHDGSDPHPFFKIENRITVFSELIPTKKISFINKFVNTYVIMIHQKHIIPSIRKKIHGHVHPAHEFVSICRFCFTTNMLSWTEK